MLDAPCLSLELCSFVGARVRPISMKNMRTSVFGLAADVTMRCIGIVDRFLDFSTFEGHHFSS